MRSLRVWISAALGLFALAGIAIAALPSHKLDAGELSNVRGAWFDTTFPNKKCYFNYVNCDGVNGNGSCVQLFGTTWVCNYCANQTQQSHCLDDAGSECVHQGYFQCGMKFVTACTSTPGGQHVCTKTGGSQVGACDWELSRCQNPQ